VPSRLRFRWILVARRRFWRGKGADRSDLGRSLGDNSGSTARTPFVFFAFSSPISALSIAPTAAPIVHVFVPSPPSTTQPSTPSLPRAFWHHFRVNSSRSSCDWTALDHTFRPLSLAWHYVTRFRQYAIICSGAPWPQSIWPLTLAHSRLLAHHSLGRKDHLNPVSHLEVAFQKIWRFAHLRVFRIPVGP